MSYLQRNSSKTEPSTIASNQMQKRSPKVRPLLLFGVCSHGELSELVKMRRESR